MNLNFDHAPPDAAEVSSPAALVLLIDAKIQLSQRVVFPDPHRGWWHSDLVSVTGHGDDLLVTDEDLDVVIGPPNRPYRVLDMYGYAAALATGDVTTELVIAGPVSGLPSQPPHGTPFRVR